MKSRQLPSDESSVRLKARGRVSEQTYVVLLAAFSEMRSISPQSPESPKVPKPRILRTGKHHLHFGARFSCEEL
ncbi:hypothetical protein MGG_14023 [Pyricularia oryzae 70-15]|uniref:Uncharacterized protein n=1 Tax=Pyricularia oryzae (strain 70-15 / ATCC MYA-4617 / FGSC 8958) TaxID=242507 RepID=G4NKX0_PYRO7|nr:uncharacterized protein MGG_14023 [Pyricularia oryzae 70-15]EHA46662.1 hypothetical protein MGG_14023 [Pyricularia oryzae 70-15]